MVSLRKSRLDKSRSSSRSRRRSISNRRRLNLERLEARRLLSVDVVRVGPGEYRTDGLDVDNGVLMLTVADDTNSFINYNVAGDDFQINIRDLQSGLREDADFSMVYVPFDNDSTLGPASAVYAADIGMFRLVNNLSVADDLISGVSASTAASSTISQADLRDQTSGVEGNWAFDNAIPGTGGDDYAVVGTGTLQVNQAGTFSFALSGDDGGRLRIDGADVIVDDTLHGFLNRFGDVALSAGAHTFEWVGFERGGQAEFELSVAAGAGKVGPVTAANGWQVVGDPSPFAEIELSGSIDVTAYYSTTAARASGPLSTNIGIWNRADAELFITGVGSFNDDRFDGPTEAGGLLRTDGMLMATSSENRNVTVEVDHVGAFRSGVSPMSLATSPSPQGGEAETDVATAFFPKVGDWVFGHVFPNGTLAARSDPGDGIFDGTPDGDYQLTRIGTGRYQLTIDGVDASSDGVLMTVGGSNEDNVTSTVIGSGWTVSVTDNSGNFREDDDFSFVYVPFDAPDLVVRRVERPEVLASQPAGGEIVVGVAPTSFVLDIDDAVDPATVAPSDLTVNGIPAESVALSNGDQRLTFTYDSSPAVQGPDNNILNVAEGAFSAASAGAGVIARVAAFSANFGYDAVLMEVTSTDPADGSVVLLPFTTLELNFNEAYDLDSAEPGDFVLSQGSVVGFSQVDADTLRLSLDGITDEGTLVVELDAGGMTDAFGNPGAAFSASYTLDFGTVPYPVPLTPKEPLGSLIYDPTKVGIIDPAGDTDSFTIEVDAGQLLTVVVDSDVSLRSTVEIRNQDGDLIGSATAGAAGESVVLQNVPTHGQLGQIAPPSKTYTITVGGADGTTGGYELQMILNAAAEDERYGGASNETTATAQDLGPAFLPLHGSVVETDGGRPERTAVLGEIVPAVFSATQSQTGLYTGNVLTFSFAAPPSTGAGTIDLTAVSDLDGFSEFVRLDIEGVVTQDVFRTGASQCGTSVDSVSLTSAQVAAITADGTVTMSFTPSGAVGSFCGSSPLTVTLAYAVPSTDNADLYRFDLSSGESATLALTELTDASDLNLELLDSSGTGLALGAGGADNVDEVISNFVASSSGVFYARVTGAGEYSLVVTRNADFDTESNNDIASAQDLLSAQAAGRQWVLGHVSGVEQLLAADDGDRHLLEVDPATGAGTIVASNVGGGRGYNALALNPATGVLYGSQSLASRGLYTIDPQSFAETFIGDLGGNVRAMAWSPDAVTLYAYRDSTFGTVDPTTAAFTSIANSGIGLVGGMAFQPGSGTLFAVTNNRGSTGLYTIDVTSGVATLVGNPGSDYNSLEFLSDGTLLGGLGRVAANPGFLVELDPSTAAPTLIGRTVPFGNRNLTGLEELPETTDFYKIDVNELSTLQVETRTPARQNGEFVNNLDPMVRVYDADGNLVAEDDNGDPDGRNARLRYRVPAGAGGTYYVEVLASPTGNSSGEYTLAVKQATGALPAFQVTATSIADGQRLRGPTTQMTVDFNDTLLLTSLDASDLTVNGTAATGFTVVDVDTVVFDLPTLAEGTQDVQISGILDIQNTPLDTFTMTFFEDLTAPRVVASSIQEDEIVTFSGDLTYTVTFDEPMRTGNLDNSDFNLRGVFANVNYTPTSASYDATGTVLTLEYAGLPEGRYTLTLFSGDGRFEDAADPNGFNLDGEPVAFPIPPNQSGDGVEGGDFVVNFDLDIGTAAFPTPLTPKSPAGSLIYDPSVSGLISPSGDTDNYTINVDPGQKITVLVDPASGLQPTVELRNPSNMLVGAAGAAATGEDALIQTVTTVAGTYTITVSGASNTTGQFSLELTLNAALESESHDGPNNDSLASAQDINASFTDLLKGATRGAVLGTTEVNTAARLNYDAASPGANPSTQWADTTGVAGFDFSLGSGVSLIPVASGFASIDAAYRFDGTNNASAVTSSLENLGGSPNVTNADASFEIWFRPDNFSDNDVLFETGGGVDGMSLTMLGNTLQFHVRDNTTIRGNLTTIGGVSTSEFNQVVGTIDFVTGGANLALYLNGVQVVAPTFVAGLADWAGPSGSGAGTNNAGLNIGGGAAGELEGEIAVFRFYDSSLSAGQVLQNFQAAGGDWYSFDVGAGERITLAADPQASGVLYLKLYDGTETLLARGSSAQTNVDEMVYNFGPLAAGTYYARISGIANTPYSLVVTTDAVFDREGNDTFATAQNFDGVVGSLGHVGGLTGSSTPSAPVSLGINLFDASNFLWDIRNDGNINNGTSDAYDGGLRHLGFPNFSSAQTEDGGREIIIGPASVGGVQVTRKIFVPSDQTYARFLEVITNTGASATSYTVPIRTNLGSDSSTQIIGTSSGDTIFATNDDWIVTDDFSNGGGDPSMLHVIAGPGGQRPALASRSGDNLSYDYNLSLQPGETQIVMHFASQNPNRATALAKGPQLAEVGLNSVAGMTTAELATVVNFNLGNAEDWYSVNLTAGVTEHFETITPADGPGEFVNTLDPKIELYDPSGTLIVSGATLADGRNEEINFTPPTTGLYRIRITAEGDTSGEYFLDPVEVLPAEGSGPAAEDIAFVPIPDVSRLRPDATESNDHAIVAARNAVFVSHVTGHPAAVPTATPAFTVDRIPTGHSMHASSFAWARPGTVPLTPSSEPVQFHRGNSLDQFHRAAILDQVLSEGDQVRRGRKPWASDDTVVSRDSNMLIREVVTHDLWDAVDPTAALDAIETRPESQAEQDGTDEFFAELAGKAAVEERQQASPLLSLFAGLVGYASIRGLDSEPHQERKRPIRPGQ